MLDLSAQRSSPVAFRHLIFALHLHSLSDASLAQGNAPLALQHGPDTTCKPRCIPSAGRCKRAALLTSASSAPTQPVSMENPDKGLGVRTARLAQVVPGSHPQHRHAAHQHADEVARQHQGHCTRALVSHTPHQQNDAAMRKRSTFSCSAYP